MSEAKQVQLRRGTEAESSVFTGAEGEMTFATDTKSPRVHGGGKAGGYVLVHHENMASDRFNYGVAGGTNSDLTLDTDGINPSSVVAGMRLRVVITQNNPAGVCTLAWGDNGGQGIKKYVGGVKVDLAQDDLQAGREHEFRFDGAHWIVTSLDPDPGLVDVGQGDLRTSTGTFSLSAVNNNSANFGSRRLTLGDTGSHVVLPGGQYGFTPLSRTSNLLYSTGWLLLNDSTSYIAGAMPYVYANESAGIQALGLQRYVSSSPPFDMGDGEAAGFMFLLVDRAGDIQGSYLADVPPWAYNGPTDITACKKCAVSGKKMRRVNKARTLEQVLDGVPAEVGYQEITQVLKQADMNVIPHPFGGVSGDLTPVLVDPMDERIAALLTHQDAGGFDEIYQAISSGMLYADNEGLSRHGPEGVLQVRLKQRSAIEKSRNSTGGD